MSLAERGCGAVSVAAKILQYRLQVTDCVTDLLTQETVPRPGPSVQGPGDSQGIPTSALLQLPAPAEPTFLKDQAHTPVGLYLPMPRKLLNADMPGPGGQESRLLHWQE